MDYGLVLFKQKGWKNEDGLPKLGAHSLEENVVVPTGALRALDHLQLHHLIVDVNLIYVYMYSIESC